MSNICSCLFWLFFNELLKKTSPFKIYNMKVVNMCIKYNSSSCIKTQEVQKYQYFIPFIPQLTKIGINKF